MPYNWVAWPPTVSSWFAEHGPLPAESATPVRRALLFAQQSRASALRQQLFSAAEFPVRHSSLVSLYAQGSQPYTDDPLHVSTTWVQESMAQDDDDDNDRVHYLRLDLASSFQKLTATELNALRRRPLDVLLLIDIGDSMLKHMHRRPASDDDDDDDDDHAMSRFDATMNAVEQLIQSLAPHDRVCVHLFADVALCHLEWSYAGDLTPNHVQRLRQTIETEFVNESLGPGKQVVDAMSLALQYCEQVTSSTAAADTMMVDADENSYRMRQVICFTDASPAVQVDHAKVASMCASVDPDTHHFAMVFVGNCPSEAVLGAYEAAHASVSTYVGFCRDDLQHAVGTLLPRDVLPVAHHLQIEFRRASTAGTAEMPIIRHVWGSTPYQTVTRTGDVRILEIPTVCPYPDQTLLVQCVSTAAAAPWAEVSVNVSFVCALTGTHHAFSVSVPSSSATAATAATVATADTAATAATAAESTSSSSSSCWRPRHRVAAAPRYVHVSTQRMVVATEALTELLRVCFRTPNTCTAQDLHALYKRNENLRRLVLSCQRPQHVVERWDEATQIFLPIRAEAAAQTGSSPTAARTIVALVELINQWQRIERLEWSSERLLNVIRTQEEAHIDTPPLFCPRMRAWHRLVESFLQAEFVALRDRACAAEHEIQRERAEEELKRFAEQLVERDVRVPHHLLCPITMNFLRHPVVASDGHTYEEEAITRWFESSSRLLSPLTGKPMPHRHLFPNHALRHALDTYQQQIKADWAASSSSPTT